VLSLEIFVGRNKLARLIAIFYAPSNASEVIIEDGYKVSYHDNSLYGFKKKAPAENFIFSCNHFEFSTRHLEGSLQFKAHASWSVGLADSWLPRKFGFVPFVWTVPGAQCSFSGSVKRTNSDEQYLADSSLFGYRDRNFGSAYTPSWRWAASPTLLPFSYHSDYDDLPLSKLLAIAQKLTRAASPSVGDALVVGGQAPEIFKKHRNNIVLLWLQGVRYVFNGFEVGRDWGYQDANASISDGSVFFSLLLRQRDLTLSCAFSVPLSSTVSYPIVDGDFQIVYNGSGGKDRLWQSGLARGIVVFKRKGQQVQAFYAPFAGIEVGELSAPSWLLSP